MSEHRPTINEIRIKAAPIAKKYGVARMYLFGSYARGDATASSDLDFRIDKGQVSGFAIGGLYGDLEEAFGKSIDLATTKSLPPNILAEIAGEEVLIYGKKE